MDAVAEVIRAFSSLAWPVLAAFAVLKLYPAISKRIERGGFTVEWGDKKISVAEATEQLRKAVTDLSSQVTHRLSPEAAPMPSRSAQASRTRVLWLDDNPQNNAYEIASLKDRDIDVVEATSTPEALKKLAERPFDLAITDMGRTEGGRFDPTAGLDFIRQARAANLTMPIFVYTTSNAAGTFGDAIKEAGGNGATSSAVELFRLAGLG